MRTYIFAATICSFSSLGAAQQSACSIDSPPPNCQSYYYAQADALVLGTGIPFGDKDPHCGTPQSLDAVDTAIKLLIARPDGYRFKDAHGDVLKFLRDSGIQHQLAEGTSGFAHDWILRNGPRAEFANCATLAAFIPKKATFVAYRLKNTDIDAASSDPNRFGGCEPGVDCSNSFSRFLGVPDLRDEDGGKAVAVVFANWSHNRRRVGHLIVFYSMPPGETPVPQW